MPGRSLRLAESLPKAPGADVLADAGGLELEAGGDLHVAGDDPELEAGETAQFPHQLGDAGQRPHPGGALGNGARVAFLQVPAESIQIRRTPFHLVTAGVEDLLQDDRVGLAVRPDGADVAGNAEGPEDGLVEGEVAVLGPEQRAVDVEEDDVGYVGHDGLELIRSRRAWKGTTAAAGGIDKNVRPGYEEGRTTGVYVEFTTRECVTAGRPNAWVSMPERFRHFFAQFPSRWNR